MKLKYFWQVEYHSGTIRKQFENGDEIQWFEINESQIKKLSWMKKTLFRSKVKASIELDPGDKLMICRRNHITPGRAEPVKTEYLLGKNGEYTIKII